MLSNIYKSYCIFHPVDSIKYWDRFQYLFRLQDFHLKSKSNEMVWNYVLDEGIYNHINMALEKCLLLFLQATHAGVADTISLFRFAQLKDQDHKLAKKNSHHIPRWRHLFAYILCILQLKGISDWKEWSGIFLCNFHHQLLPHLEYGIFQFIHSTKYNGKDKIRSIEYYIRWYPLDFYFGTIE